MDAPRAALALSLCSLMLAVPTAFAAGPDGAASPQRWVIALDEMPAGLAEHGRFLGAEVAAVDRALGFVAVTTGDAHGLRERAAQERGVRWLEADPLLPLAAFTPNDPEFGVSQYGPQLVGAPAAWDRVAPGVAALPLACVVDSGVRRTHGDLAATYAGGIDYVNGDADPSDDFGHGTHVAGILAAATNNGAGIAGVAGGRFLAAKVLDASGNGLQSNVASAIRWCVDQGAKVVSVSLGHTAGSSVLQMAVDDAWSRGALVFAAAGNGNSCTDCVQYPARYTNAIAVGCVDQYRRACAFASTGPDIDLAAPGNAIQSTWWTGDADYQRAGGTSMSTPHAAGAAVLAWGAHPGWTNAQVRQALEASAQDVAAAGKDAQTGFGLVRADLALDASVSPAPAPTPSPTPSPGAGVSISPASQAKSVPARGQATYQVVVHNDGAANDTVTLSAKASRNGWGVSLPTTSLQLAPGASATVSFTVTAPAKSAPMTLTLTAASQLDAAVKATATATTSISK